MRRLREKDQRVWWDNRVNGVKLAFQQSGINSFGANIFFEYTVLLPFLKHCRF